MAGLVDVVATGARRESLECLRDHLAKVLVEPETLAQSTAGLAKQLADVLRELDSLAAPEVSAKDDLRKKRDARRAAAKVPTPGAGGRKRRA